MNKELIIQVCLVGTGGKLRKSTRNYKIIIIFKTRSEVFIDYVKQSFKI